MPLFSACDIRAIVDALGGVDVTVGGVTIKGVVREPDRPLLEQYPELVGRVKSVMVVTADLPALGSSKAITIAGESMKVHAVMAEYDGTVTRILAKVA